jgi:hypothetical protein
MTGILSEVFLYKGSDVDNKMADYLIDEVYRKKQLLLINTEYKIHGNRDDQIRRSEVNTFA